MSLDFEVASETEMLLAEGRLDGDAGKKRNSVEFYRKSKFNPEKSKLEGRAICDPADYVRIQCPGDKLNIIDREATAEDKRDYRDRFEAYKRNSDQDAASGTLLALTGRFSPERIEELGHALSGRVRTVEQYASIPDEVCQRLGPAALTERKYCVEFLEASKGSAPVAKLRAEIEERDARIAAMEKNLADLASRMGEREPVAKRKSA